MDAFANSGITFLTHLKFYKQLDVGGGLHSVRQPFVKVLVLIFCTLPSMLLLQAVNFYRGFEDIASSLSPSIARGYAQLYANGFPVPNGFPITEIIWPCYTPLLVFLVCSLLTSPLCPIIHYVTFEVSHAGVASDDAGEELRGKSSGKEGYGTVDKV